jgi:hypothetical protein
MECDKVTLMDEIRELISYELDGTRVSKDKREDIEELAWVYFTQHTNKMGLCKDSERRRILIACVYRAFQDAI